MRWSKHIWQEIQPIYQEIQAMAFIEELKSGTLPLEKFKFYMSQDALYLEQFARALATIATKVDAVNTSLAFLEFAQNAILVERALHEHYFAQFGVTETSEMQPVCHHYTAYLKSTAAFESVAVAVAAVLPCFWIYKAIGDYIYETANTSENPYEEWIATYAGEAFGEAVQKAIAIADELAAKATAADRKKMDAAFVTASRLEYQFWNAAYTLQRW